MKDLDNIINIDNTYECTQNDYTSCKKTFLNSLSNEIKYTYYSSISIPSVFFRYSGPIKIIKKFFKKDHI